MITKILNILSVPFKKLKVFHQILIIVVIMTGFLALEGFLGVHSIDTMERVTQELFSQTMAGIVNTNEFTNAANRLQLSYLMDLLNATSYTKGLLHEIEATFTSNLTLLEKNCPDEAESLRQEFAKIKAIVDQPVSRENYRRVETILGNTRIIVNSVTNKLQTTAVESMHSGNNFSETTRWNTILILIIGMITATLIAFLITVFIARPLKAVGLSANALAEGNLIHSVQAEGSVEVVNVVGSINKAIAGLGVLVRGINEQATMLYYSGQELKKASNETGQSAAEVARAMEELSKGSTEQTEQLNRVVAHVNNLAEMVRKVSAEVRDMSLDSENIGQFAKLGQSAAADVSQEIVKLYNSTKEVTGVINDLNEASAEIGEITTVIQQLAEQTALLALNASIEAARAGEHGKGFAVVAKETGKLAEQSKRSAIHINELINQMKRKTEHAVTTISSGMTVVESGKELATKATVTFGNIFARLENILTRIDSVALSARGMANSNEQVIHAITQIAALSEESMASTEEVSATAQEQTASVEEVAALAENLVEIAGKLKESIAVFKTQ